MQFNPHSGYTSSRSAQKVSWSSSNGSVLPCLPPLQALALPCPAVRTLYQGHWENRNYLSQNALTIPPPTLVPSHCISPPCLSFNHSLMALMCHSSLPQKQGSQLEMYSDTAAMENSISSSSGNLQVPLPCVPASAHLGLHAKELKWGFKQAFMFPSSITDYSKTDLECGSNSGVHQ